MSDNSTSWEDDFMSLLQGNDSVRAIACLDAQKTSHAGTPPQAIKNKAIRIIRKIHKDDAESVYNLAITFANSENNGAKEIGVYLLPPFYASCPEHIDEIVYRLGDDDHWEVREWAASAFAYVISGHFDLVYPRLQRWQNDDSSNIRRMVAVAIGFATRDCDEEQCRRLLPILESFLPDRDPYVSKNLGAYAIGNCALHHQPILTGKWLTSINPSDEQTAWNLAMIFSTSVAAKQFAHIQSLLVGLVNDERQRVQRAVKKGIKNINKRTPEQIEQLLDSWADSVEHKYLVQKIRSSYL
ncbi:DNA alkylation repair protein [Chloroflexi bacterium TSY]|nr:DNA alkylation repair protein [Chloroflexi bacterium TSY]